MRVLDIRRIKELDPKLVWWDGEHASVQLLGEGVGRLRKWRMEVLNRRCRPRRRPPRAAEYFGIRALLADLAPAQGYAHRTHT